MYLIDRIFRSIAAAIVAAFFLTGIGMSAANAQAQTQITASAFRTNPKALLEKYPDGGQQLIDLVQRLVLEDPTTFSLLLGLLPEANNLQRGAIGYGLAQATKSKITTDQAQAVDWQQLIATVDYPAFKTAALAAIGDVQITATGVAGGGGPLGGPLEGPGGLGGTGPAEEIRSTPVATPFFTYGGSTTGGSASLIINNPSTPVSVSK
jgi:hypothetical protein